MIYIRIELWPGGNRHRAKTLSEVVIANVGGDQEEGIYNAYKSEEGGFTLNPATDSEDRIHDPNPASIQARLTGVHHFSDLGFWKLIRRIFNKFQERELLEGTSPVPWAEDHLGWWYVFDQVGVG